MFHKAKRTNDDRINNLKAIDLNYYAVGVHGVGITPSDLRTHIKKAIKDMTDLVNEVEALNGGE